MKKETIIAVVLGIGLGVVVAVFLAFKSRQAQIQKTNPLSSELSISPTPPKTSSSVEALEISEPQNGTIVNSNTVTIKGKVAKDSLIIIQSPIKTQVIKNSPEDLNTQFPVALGDNIINIVVYPKDSQVSIKERQLEVYYLDEQ